MNGRSNNREAYLKIESTFDRIYNRLCILIWMTSILSLGVGALCLQAFTW